MEDFVKQKHGVGKSNQKQSNRKQIDREESPNHHFEAAIR